MFGFSPKERLTDAISGIFGKDPAKAAEGTKEATPEGLDTASQAINSNVETMLGSADIPNSKAYPSLYKGLMLYSANWGNCVSRQSKAASVCLETKAPALAALLPQLNILMSAAGASVNDSCSKFANAMDLVKAGLTAYTAACGTMKAGCGYSCVQARKGLELIDKGLKESSDVCANPQSETCIASQKKFNAARAAASENVPLELAKGDKKSVAGKEALCSGKYTELALSAVAGISSVANSMNQAKKCDDDTSASNTAAQTLEQKCAIEANAKLPECICLKNPMLEGCGSTAVKGTTSAEGFGSVSSSGDKTVGKGKGLNSGDLAMDGSSVAEGKDTASAGGAPAPVGGGGGGGAGLGGVGGGSGSGRDPADDKTGQKALNANILGGGGGGGGGGGWGARGGGSDSSKGYRSYLPGGDKDPNKMAGQQSWTKEVTGQGGKSNWEKVKDRYRDNKSTLLSN